MSTNLLILIFSYPAISTFILVLISQYVFSNQYGNPNWKFHNLKCDSNYPEIKEFARVDFQGKILYQSSPFSN